MRPLAITTLVLLLLSPAAAQAAGDWSWPVEGELVTTYRNGDDPYAGGQHRGIDLAAPVGRAVATAAGGTVTFAGTVGSAGRTVTVRTDDGRFDTSYLHLDSIDVREGDVVSAGTRLGTVGDSGQGSVDRPHLHFGVREAGSDHAYVDPLPLLAPPASRRPPPAPAPLPVEAPVAARPEPVRVPAGGPARVRIPHSPGAPARLPAPRGLPAPLPARLPRQLPALRSLRDAVPARAPAAVASPALRDRPIESGRSPASHADRRAAGVRAGEGQHHGRPGRDRAPARGPNGEAPTTGPHGREAPALGRLEAPPRRAASAPGGAGPDVGWAVACIGLALAALAIARPRWPRRRSPLPAQAQRARRTSLGMPEKRA